MRQKKILRTLLNLVLLSLLSLGATCNKVKIPNTRHYSVAGKFTGGAFWAETLSDESGEITMGEFIDFIEPRPELKDTDGKIIIPQKGAAVCQSSGDWIKQKIAMEQSCAMLKDQCSFELKTAIATVKKNIDGLQIRSMKRREDIDR